MLLENFVKRIRGDNSLTFKFEMLWLAFETFLKHVGENSEKRRIEGITSKNFDLLLKSLISVLNILLREVLDFSLENQSGPASAFQVI